MMTVCCGSASLMWRMSARKALASAAIATSLSGVMDPMPALSPKPRFFRSDDDCVLRIRFSDVAHERTKGFGVGSHRHLAQRCDGPDAGSVPETTLFLHDGKPLGIGFDHIGRVIGVAVFPCREPDENQAYEIER